MSSRHIRLMVVAVVVAGMLVTGGCAPKTKSSTTTKTASTKKATTSSTSAKKVSSEEPTTTTTDAKAAEPGPITTPASGSKTRTALLNAARKKLGSSTDLTVHQLYMQDDTAIGDLQPASGNRAFFAWVKTDGAWTATERWAFGSASANAVSVARALPDFTDELIGKINWKLSKPKTSGTGSASSMKSSLSAAAKAWAKSEMDGQGQPYKVTLVKAAKDSKGTWWGRAVVAPTGEYERLQYWAKYSGSTWSGEVQDPEPPAPKTYFPSSVLSSLGF